MRAPRHGYLLPLLAGGLVLAGGCTAKVEEKGQLPKVNVEDGALPKMKVERARVEVTTDTQQVLVPTVNVVRDTTQR